MAYANQFPVTYNNGYPQNGTQMNQTAGYAPGYAGHANIPAQNYQQAPQGNVSYPNQITTSIAWVNGEIEARAYPVAPGNQVYLMDVDGSTFYVKGTDFNGMPLPFKVNSYAEVVQTTPNIQASHSNSSQADLSGYVRIEDIEDIVAQEVERRMAAAPAKAGTKKEKADA